MKPYPLVLMVAALAVAQPVFAAPGNETVKADKSAKADKSEKSDKAEKSKADKDKSGKDKSDKEKAAKDKAEKDETAKDDAAQASAEGTAAQTPADPAAAAPAEQEERDDAVLDLAQPDFTVVNLPTTLRLPKFKSAFRVSHRFARPLGDGSFGELAEDFFALDASAQVGLEFRFGLWSGLQGGIYRTSDRTINFFGQYDVKQQSESFPVSIAAYAAVDGTNNFRDSYRPAVGAVISRTIQKYAAVYVMPMWVNNTNELPSELADDNSTFLLGVGGRVRIHGGTYFVLEVAPRVSGFDPGVNAVSFGIEKRVGGHAFQMNFSNSIGTTIGQVARGGLRDTEGNQDWYLGFNISRKFF